MSEMQEVEVEIGPDGTVLVKVRGAKGGQCLAITKKLEALLGNNVRERTQTDEFHETAEQGDQAWTSR